VVAPGIYKTRVCHFLRYEVSDACTAASDQLGDCVLDVDCCGATTWVSYLQRVLHEAT